jgi:hypothetical protein
MPQKKTLPTAEQISAIDAYCEKHNLTPSVAGRIAWARLIGKAPTRAEIESATIPAGNLANLKQFREQ